MNRYRLAQMLAAAVGLLLGMISLVQIAMAVGTWSPTDSLSALRVYHTATLLQNGKVLVVGGYNNSTVLATTELYDPDGGKWSQAGTLATARHNHTATLLPNGKVLVVGGWESAPLNTAELFDPATGQWSGTGNMNAARWFHTATLLADGRVLVAGGNSASRQNPDVYDTAEIYDPGTGEWTITGNLNVARNNARATLLSDGRVLVVGGQDENFNYLASSEIYDPSTEQWSSTGSLKIGRYGHTMTLLPDGGILVAGGTNGTPLDSAEIYDTASGQWSSTESMLKTRLGASATLMPNGKVLVTAGIIRRVGIADTSSEIYDPATSQWENADSLTDPRYAHTATLLLDGRILVTGGERVPLDFLASAELYSPDPSDLPPLSISTQASLPTGTVGQSYTWILQSIGGTPPYTWAVVDGSLPLGLELDPATGAIRGIPTAAASWSFKVLVSDADNAIATKQFTIIATSDAPPPSDTDLTIITNSFLPSGAVDEPYSVFLQASGGVEPYTWSTLEGSLPPGLVLNEATGEISGTPTTAGTFGFVIQVMDSSGNTDDKPFVTAPPPSSGSTGSHYSNPIVVTDPSPTPTTCSNYAVVSGSLPGGLTLDATTGVVSGTPATEGTYYFVVQCINDGGQTATKAFSITIYANLPPSADAGGPYIGQEGASIPLDGATASDPDGDPLTYAWTVNSPLCSFSDPTVLNSTITCDDDGDYTVTLTVVDDADVSANDQTAIMVKNVSPTATFVAPASVNEGGSFSLSLTDLFDPSSSDTAAGLEYAFDCGDGSGYSAWRPVGSIGCPTDDDALRTVKGEIRDKDGGVSEYTASVLIENVAPVVGPISVIPVPSVIAVEGAVTVNARFTDVGTADTYIARWNWGDGNLCSTASSAAQCSLEQGSGAGSTSGTHVYAEAGVYTIHLTVTDDDNGIGESSYQYVVAYDPEGGFVTGGGWIHSPEGAYRADTTLTGKASFGFVSKYKKGADIPTGVTEFQFRTADLNFHSSSYEWLVVAGAKAQYKGQGTINGVGSYYFFLTGIDADVNDNDSHVTDKFRIKIWQEVDGVEDVIYDNQVVCGDEATLDADPCTQLGDGSIVVHDGKSSKSADLERTEGVIQDSHLYLPAIIGD